VRFNPVNPLNSLFSNCCIAEPLLQPKPAAAQQALQQITMAVVTSVPIALQAALNNGAYNQAPDAQDFNQPRVSAGDIAAGRDLWSNQANLYDRLSCVPFNGHQRLLTDRPTAAAELLAQQQLAAAAAAVNATRAGFDSLVVTSSGRAAAAAAAAAAASGGLAAVSWDGEVTLGASFYPEGLLVDADVALAGNVLSDLAQNLVPWMRVQVGSVLVHARALLLVVSAAAGMAGGVQLLHVVTCKLT
jgi:hypothetical protein